MIYRRHDRAGFSLIEVLVALLIFSLGLIGLAGLLVMSTQANQGAFIRTQATFLGHNLADRMRANMVGVWQNNYNASDYPQAAGSTAAPTCSAAAPCTPAQVAARDRSQWSGMLRQYLPDDSNLNATVNCTPDPNGLAMSSYYTTQPPYSGWCTMNVSWTERSLAIGVGPSVQTFSWTFQP